MHIESSQLVSSPSLFRFMEEKGGCEEKIGTPKEADLH